MIELARDIIGTQPILALFLAIGVGYLVGQINLGGFSLGVGAVLFVGLAIGAFAPKAQITGPIGLTGLIMFLYGIGILYGRQFFEGMTGAAGRKYNLLALVAVVAGLAGRAGARPGLRHQDRPHARHLRRLDDQHRHAAGRARRHEEQRSVDRLFDRLSLRRDRPDPVHLFHDAPGEAEIPAEGAAVPHGRDDARATTAPAARWPMLSKDLPDGVQVTMVRKGDQNVVPSADIVLASGDGLLIVAEQRGRNRRSGRTAWESWSPAASSRIARPSTTSGFSSARPTWSACRSRNCRCRPAFRLISCMSAAMTWTSCRRPDLTLEFGDRVGVLMPPDRKEEIRRHFGDTVKATAEFSYVSLGLGMVLGVLLGLIPIPIPGVGTVTLGIGGGPLIVALILGKLRRTGPMLWVMPLPANIVLRNFGLAMFLAAVGINAGQPFVRTVSETGLTMLFIGVAVLLTTVLIVLLVGYYLMKIPYDDLVGVASGATGNPAILVYSTRMAPTERPDIGYAMIFPSMTIVKVIAVQIVGLLVATGAG